MNFPIIKKILTTQQETSDIRTITFSDETPTQPGQFYMIWIPGIDEIPMSVSKIEPLTKSITFRKIGDATTNLFQLPKGALIGVRGPFGNGYQINGKNILFVGGGTGIAMLAPAIEQAIQQKRKTTVIIGVKTETELFFIKRLQPHVHQLEISTDDGTYGFTGYASDLAHQLINTNNYDAVLTCGPEPMMKSLLNTCIQYHLPFQASLERHMKCALGICGQCSIGDGQRVCIDGPIFTDKQLREYPDFGLFKRDASGRKIPI